MLKKYKIKIVFDTPNYLLKVSYLKNVCTSLSKIRRQELVMFIQTKPFAINNYHYTGHLSFRFLGQQFKHHVIYLGCVFQTNIKYNFFFSMAKVIKLQSHKTLIQFTEYCVHKTCKIFLKIISTELKFGSKIGSLRILFDFRENNFHGNFTLGLACRKCKFYFRI